jgi:hypothetical protein
MQHIFENKKLLVGLGVLVLTAVAIVVTVLFLTSSPTNSNQGGDYNISISGNNDEPAQNSMGQLNPNQASPSVQKPTDGGSAGQIQSTSQGVSSQ